MNRLRDLGAQDGVIQRGKMLDDISAQHVAISPRAILQLIHRAMCAFAGAVGVAVGDEPRFEDWLDHVA
jgi:hypothetical protein